MGVWKNKGRSSFLGAGIYFLSDKAGDVGLGSNQINLSVAYHLEISAVNTISVGLQGGYAFRSINAGKLQWDSQFNGISFDPSLPSDEPSTFSTSSWYADFGTGVQWTYSNGEMNTPSNDHLMISAGIAAYHVNRPELSFYSSSPDNLPMKFVFHASSMIGLKDTKYSIAPDFVYMQQSQLKDIIIGIAVRKNLSAAARYTGSMKGAAVSLGAYYRLGDAIIPNVQIEFANYALGLSYNVNTSGLTKATSGRGGFEISLRFLNRNPFLKGQNNALFSQK